MRIAMRTPRPSTTRITCGGPSPRGMKSITRAEPSVVSKSVSSTSVPARYRRSVRVTSPAGAICQRPWLSSPSRAAKHAPESNRGRQSQSIDPLRPTSAAVRMSPMSP